MFVSVKTKKEPKLSGAVQCGSFVLCNSSLVINGTSDTKLT